MRTSFALVGSTPGLAIGTVFRDGQRVGRLAAREVTLEFDKRESHSDIRLAREPAASVLSAWPDLGLPRNLVPMSKYRIPGFHGGNCLVIHDARQAVVLPCFEVFRSFYAPHGDIALALTSGPWASRWKDVANPDDTRALSDGTWQIGLRRRIRNEHAPILANLILNPIGHDAASQIFGSLLRSRQTPAPAQFDPLPRRQDGEPAAPARGTDTAFPLRADIPFEWERLAIKARCACWHKDPDEYFAFEVTEITWPDAPFVAHSIDYDRDNSGRAGHRQTLSNQRRPYIKIASELNLAAGEPVPVTTDEDPRMEPTSVLFPVLGPAWLNTPSLRPVLKPVSFTYEDVQCLTRAGEPATEVSAGLAGGAGSDAVRAQYFHVARSPLPGCFGQVIDALARLEQKGKITGWNFVHPPQDAIEYRGGIPAWPVSGKEDKRAWSWVGEDRKRVRGALVCEMRWNNATLLWLDIETRSPADGFYALLWRPGTMEWTAAIGMLLKIAVDKRGIWPDAATLAEAVQVGHVQKWKHFHDKTERARLDLKSLLLALRKAVREAS